jgi:hypothetical protein
MPDPTKWEATREVASAHAEFLKAIAELDAAQADYLAALQDLADYRQEMVDDYKLAQQADYESDTGHA